MDATLGDPEAKLTVGPGGVSLPLGPQRRAPDGLLVVVLAGVRGWADVEAHGDVRAEPALDLGHAFRCQSLGGAVVDGAKRDAVVVDRQQRVAQREHLEAPRVGEDRPVPARERVQTAVLGDDLLAGSEVQVVGVGEDHVGAHGPHLVGMQALDGRLGADGHERRGRDLAVRRPHDPGPGSPVGRVQDEAVAHRISIASPNE